MVISFFGGHRHAGGSAIYVKSSLRCQILAKSSKVDLVNYLFLEIRFNDRHVLVASFYDPPGIPGFPFYGHILSDLIPRYPNNVLSRDFSPIFRIPDPDDQVRYFDSLFVSIFQECVPLKRCPVSVVENP
jgi:hypothetical protein